MGNGRAIFLGLAAVMMAGCGTSDSTVITDEKGNKVTVSDNGTKASFEGAKGETTTVETDSEGGGKMTIKTDKGDQTLSAGTGITEEELGMTFYPGSADKEGGSMKTDTPEASSRLSVRTTADAPSKVVAFYKDKIKEPSTVSASSGGNENEILTGKLEDGATVQITASREKGSSETVVNVLVTRTKK